MVFPATPLDARVELQLGGTWTQVQASPTGVRGNDKIAIHRGRADEQSSVEASTATMALNNRDGRYSPRNPNSPYYGQIGRNTPLRVSVPGDGTKALRVPGRYGLDNVSAPDVAGFHIVGDLDVRIDVTLDNWAQYQTLAQRYTLNGTANSWILYLVGSNVPRFVWSANGSAETAVSATVPVSAQPGTRLALRVTLAVATGTLTFWTAPTISGAWTQLGAPIVAGATSVFAGTNPIVLGETGQGRVPGASIMAGRINAFQLLNGIGGAAVANPDFTAQTLGATSFADAAGNTWTLNGSTEITDRRYRMHGEVSSFPPKWDVSGTDVWTPIEGAGILRRLGQGTALAPSPIYRATSRFKPGAVAYWPCEDVAGSTSLVSATGGQAMLFTGAPSLSSDSRVGGSAPLPQLNSSSWYAQLPAYTGTSLTVAWVMAVGPGGMPNGAVVARFFTSGSSGTRWDVIWNTTGPALELGAWDVQTGTQLMDPTLNTLSVTNGEVCCVSVTLQQSGAVIKTGFGVGTPATGFSTTQGTSGTRTLGKVTQIQVDTTANITDTAFGHLAVFSPGVAAPVSSAGFPPQQSSLSGNAGEAAGARFMRLCQEEGITPRTVGDPLTTNPMGPQGADTIINLLQSCADADGGVLYEPRDVFGLGLRMRSSLMAQTPLAVLSHNGGQLAGTLEPIDDDQLIRNDVTVTRLGGASARATLDSGTLSTLDPPNGVGRYPDTPTLNLQSDTLLINEAAWRVNLGTVDAARFPVVQVAMASNEMVANPTLAQNVQRLDIGSVLTLTGMPSWLPPDDVNLLAQGVTETMSNFEFTISLNCSPAAPYDVLVLDTPPFNRLDTDGSSLGVGVNTTATSWSVATALGNPLWTTNAGDWPFVVRIGGETVTVTAVAGTTSPQTFTVTRSANGISKSHLAGEDIRLARPVYVSI
jgi:hypothetical protein